MKSKSTGKFQYSEYLRIKQIIYRWNQPFLMNFNCRNKNNAIGLNELCAGFVLLLFKFYPIQLVRAE